MKFEIRPHELTWALSISLAASLYASLAYFSCDALSDMLDLMRLSSPYCENNSDPACEFLLMRNIGVVFLCKGLLLLAMGWAIKRYFRCWPAFSTGAFMAIPTIWAYLSIFGGFYSPNQDAYLTVICGAGYGVGLLLDLKYLSETNKTKVA